MMMTDDDIRFMHMALTQAAKGLGRVNPNPLVGAVIVRGSRIIGVGYHKQFGGPHAEINAMRNAENDVEGATVYVTLEPCSHYGKTPPCADALITAKVAKVVIAMTDPNPFVSGRGIQRLKENGIEVEVGLLENEARELNRVFIKYIRTKLPYVVLKSAMTLDGKIATASGHSQWISCPQSRKYVHSLRNELKGILVGVNTVITDDPELTTRLDGVSGRNPVRIVVDSRGRIPLNAKMLKNGAENPVIIATTENFPEQKRADLIEAGHQILILPAHNEMVDLNLLMIELGKLGIDGILLEGGGTLNESALKSGIVDEVQFFIAPLLLGGRNAMTPVEGKGFDTVAEGIRLQQMTTRQVGDDILITAKVKATKSE
ncbi:MAG: bifunctional diaminohydroxyphosphoribosylaminopyrimidine deaminase/5-amino-6-(5-phosphoribosylamino)uracil reductase RibD [Bacteroidota bacterium]|nr:bifunctional diaminohydroxyphosphoribosylaminopyrimidine deaminase/5-amino-6-(5-phosphoribosylamino)uracil reductase RibD [Bacteroidota bacterium]